MQHFSGAAWALWELRLFLRARCPKARSIRANAGKHDLESLANIIDEDL